VKKVCEITLQTYFTILKSSIKYG